jgi:hypothetical protein
MRRVQQDIQEKHGKNTDGPTSQNRSTTYPFLCPSQQAFCRLDRAAGMAIRKSRIQNPPSDRHQLHMPIRSCPQLRRGEKKGSGEYMMTNLGKSHSTYESVQCMLCSNAPFNQVGFDLPSYMCPKPKRSVHASSSVQPRSMK